MAGATALASPVVLAIDAERDITINGGVPDGAVGVDVAIGDINDDGADDLIVGAPFVDPGQRPGAGVTYVLYGPLDSATFDLPTDADLILNGIDGSDNAGFGVASGDVNGDGKDDIVIGANGADPLLEIAGQPPLFRERAGETYVIFGPILNSGTQSTLEIDTVRDATFNGVFDRDGSGISVAVGDLDDDGVGDLIVGANLAAPGQKSAAGTTSVVFGPVPTGTQELSEAAHLVFNGIDELDTSGYRVASGDVNHDGKDDLIIGATGGDPDQKDNVGETNVILGPIAFLATRVELELGTERDLTINGVAAGDRSGAGVATGDFDGDGVSDLLIGSEQANQSAGQTYVLRGPLQGTVLEVADAHVTIDGNTAEHLGLGLAAGDVNDDGATDLVIGAPNATPGQITRAGAAYVLLGEPPIKPPAPAALDANWAFSPPKIDGQLDFGEWDYSNRLPFQHGFLTVKSDMTRLYVLLDVLDDGIDDSASEGPSDHFWLTFDVNGDGRITPDVDLNYALDPATGNMRYQHYLGPDRWTGLRPLTRSSKAKGFDCFSADGSLAFSAGGSEGFTTSCSKHRVWELAIDLREIGALVGQTVKMGVRVASPAPVFEDDLPANFTQDFSSFIDVKTSPVPQGVIIPIPSILATVGFDLLGAIEVTQAIQDRQNTLPLVRDKTTVARVYV